MKCAWRKYGIIYIVIIFLPIILWVGNYSIYGYWFPWTKILAVALLIGMYFFLLYGAWILVINYGGWIRQLIGILIIILLSFSLFNVSYWAIYKWFPKLGIMLYDSKVAFDTAHFRSRIISNFIFLFLFSLASALYRAYRLRTQRIHSLSDQLEQLKDQFSAAHIFPHFVESITGMALGQSLFNSNPQGRLCLEQLAAVMRYILHNQSDLDRLVPLQAEWSQVERLVDIARWKYGKHKLSVIQIGRMDSNLMILPVSLITLLENALKYTDLNEQWPIKIKLNVDMNGYSFSCSNPISLQKPPGRTISGFGLQNLRNRMERSKCNFQLKVDHQPDHFTVDFSHQSPEL